MAIDWEGRLARVNRLIRVAEMRFNHYNDVGYLRDLVFLRLVRRTFLREQEADVRIAAWEAANPETARLYDELFPPRRYASDLWRAFDFTE